MIDTREVDRLVGQRIRQARWRAGRTLTWLSEEVGMTQQQISKVERGDNRLSAGQLFQIAKALDVPVGDFFSEITGGDTPSRESMVLAAIYDQLPQNKREALMMVARALSE